MKEMPMPGGTKCPRQVCKTGVFVLVFLIFFLKLISEIILFSVNCRFSFLFFLAKII